MKSWFRMQAMASAVLAVSIHDEIGTWGVSAKDFLQQLNAHRDVERIELSLHSPGGSVFDGLAMYNGLMSHPAEVVARVEGIAASAATTVLMAADKIVMPEDTFLMIHSPWTMAVGNSNELSAVVDTLEKIKQSMATIYVRRTGLAMERVLEIMDTDTWLTATEAKALGFADEVADPVEIAALSPGFAKHFANLPRALQSSGPDQVPEFANVSEFERYLREAGGFSKGLAATLTSRARKVLRSESADTVSAKAAQGLLAVFDEHSFKNLPPLG